jgi:hypothetical protein
LAKVNVSRSKRKSDATALVAKATATAKQQT